ncbi:hypothetical protein [Bifidobacterium animalis]|uniref:hypothetical protein n=1 Tax=Bifidobacterium animalis TaxID=28025 RepID=UPI003B75CC6D
MTDGRFGYAAFVTDVFARRIVGWACATSMNTEELPLQALEQAISWAAGTAAPGGSSTTPTTAPSTSARCTPRACASTGCCPRPARSATPTTTPLAESVNAAYKTELVWRRKPFRDVGDLELATFQWVSWWNSKRSTPAWTQDTRAGRTEYYTNQATQAASL